MRMQVKSLDIIGIARNSRKQHVKPRESQRSPTERHMKSIEIIRLDEQNDLANIFHLFMTKDLRQFVLKKLR